MGDPRRRRIKRGFSQGVGGDAATELSTRPKLHIGRTHEGVWALDVLECNFPGYVQGIGGIVQATLRMYRLRVLAPGRRFVESTPVLRLESSGRPDSRESPPTDSRPGFT